MSYHEQLVTTLALIHAIQSNVHDLCWALLRDKSAEIVQRCDMLIEGLNRIRASHVKPE